MSQGSTRFVAFGGSRIRIDFAGPRATEIVEFLYRDARDNADDSLQATFHVEDDAAGDLVTVRRDNVVSCKGVSPADAARALQDATSFSLAAGSTGGLLLHAAAVSRGEHVVLLPGKSGTGKTTLTAWLLTLGFRYLTDELSFIADGSLSIEALSRPLNVKQHGHHALPAGLNTDSEWASLRGTVTALLQPPARMTGLEWAETGQSRVAAVVFPHYQPAARSRLKPLSQAQTGLRLMSCLLNARNLDEHGFPAVAALARQIPSYELSSRDFKEAAPGILELVS